MQFISELLVLRVSRVEAREIIFLFLFLYPELIWTEADLIFWTCHAICLKTFFTGPTAFCVQTFRTEPTAMPLVIREAFLTDKIQHWVRELAMLRHKERNLRNDLRQLPEDDETIPEKQREVRITAREKLIAECNVAKWQAKLAKLRLKERERLDALEDDA